MICTSKLHASCVAAMLALLSACGGEAGGVAGGQDAFPQAGAGMPQGVDPYAAQGGQGQFPGGIPVQEPNAGPGAAYDASGRQQYSQAPYQGQPQFRQAPYPQQQPYPQQAAYPGQPPQERGPGAMQGPDGQPPTQAQMEKLYLEAEARRRQIHDAVMDEIRQGEADE